MPTPALYVLSGKEQEQPVLGSNATFVPYNLCPPGEYITFLSFSFPKCKVGIIVATFRIDVVLSEIVHAEPGHGGGQGAPALLVFFFF